MYITLAEVLTFVLVIIEVIRLVIMLVDRNDKHNKK